jgi:hypothetical protein
LSGADTVEKVIIPSSVTSIGAYALQNCTSLTEITLPSSATWINTGIFADAPLAHLHLLPPTAGNINTAYQSLFTLAGLTLVTLDNGWAEIPANAFTSAVNVERIRIPESVKTIAGGAFTGAGSATTNGQITIFSHYDTYATQYAKDNNIPYVTLTDILVEEIPHAYMYIPYLYQIETDVPGNAGVTFELAPGSSLPNGMRLETDGELFAAPYDKVEEDMLFPFTVYAFSEGDPSHWWPSEATFTLYVEEIPTDAVLLAINDYVIAIPIEKNITGLLEQVVNQIFKTSGEYPDFDSFWINGIEQTLALDFTKAPGSTVITIMAKTIKDLDNGEYTAAAAFRHNEEDVLTVVAQNFTVELTRPLPGSENNSGNGDGNNSGNGSGNTPNETNSSSNTGNNSVNTPGNNPNTANNPANTPGSVSSTPEGNPGTLNSSNIFSNPANAANVSGNDTASPANSNMTAANANAPANAIGPDAAALNNPAGAANLVGGSDAGTGAGAEDDTGSPGNLPESLAGAISDGSISGLERGADGRYIFSYDGSGKPLEVRINTPLEDFNGLYFDGAAWELGSDYDARSGSTILTISANKLSGIESGLHTMRAQFATGPVIIEFLLQKATAETSDAAGGSIPAVYIAFALVMIVGGGTMLFKRRRQKRA